MRTIAPKLLPVLTLLLLAMLLLAAPFALKASTPAHDGVVFSKDYTIGWFRLLVSMDRFEYAPEHDSETVICRITRLTPNKRFNAGLLRLDSRWVTGFQQFLAGDAQVLELELPVKHKGRHHLFLLLHGDRGARLRIEILADEQPPLPPTASIVTSANTVTYGDSFILSWSTEHAETVSIEPEPGMVDTVGSATLAPASDTVYTLTATGPGGEATASVAVNVVAATAPQPDNSFGQTYEQFIPPNAAIQDFDPARFALLTGQVNDLSGSPLRDVEITVLGSEDLYGTARTDASGAFAIPVQGGGAVTLRYEKDGYIQAQRTANAPWNDVTVFDAVTLTPFDSQATTVVPDGNPAHVTVHHSSPLSDEYGTRTVTMVFPGDIKAYRQNPDGSQTELTAFTVRATEFPTPASMPAVLPPTVQFTWCAELSADEAEHLVFDRPVTLWVDNFLGFDVGLTVPVGYYDRTLGAWVPADNGLVVQLLDTDGDGIVDGLDADGDGLPDDLDGDGILADEVLGREDATPGATYMRATVTHFTPWDCNYPVALPEDAAEPDAMLPPPECEPCDNSVGSHVSHRDQVYHKDLAIPGIDGKIHYASDRADGYARTVDIPLSGDTLPASCTGIRLEATLAGKVIRKEFPPTPNLVETISWDGRDAWGAPAPSANLRVRIGYTYDATFAIPAPQARAFGLPGVGSANVMVRAPYTLWRDYQRNLESRAIPRDDLGQGWTLGSHHRLNPADPTTLYKGDGTVLRPKTSTFDFFHQITEYYGDVRDLSVTTDGDYVYGTPYAIKRFDPEDPAPPRTICGDGLHTASVVGIDGPAVDAKITYINDVAVAPNGEIYFTTLIDVRVLKIDTNGILRLVAGTGERGYSGDGGPATLATFDWRVYLTLDNDGNIYLADENNNVIRKIDPAGHITTIAGTGALAIESRATPGRPARQSPLGWIRGIACDSKGTLYFTCWGWHAVYSITPDGILHVVAGIQGQRGSSPDGLPATASRLSQPNRLALDAQDHLYIAEYRDTNRVRKLGADGRLRTVLGSPSTETVAGRPVAPPYFQGSGATLTQPCRYPVYNLDIAPNGDIAFSAVDYCAPPIGRVVQSQSVRRLLAEGELLFPDDDGTGHVMAADGRHLRTIDLATGATLLTFAHDDAGRLTSQTDRFGDSITIERDDTGLATAIVSPDNLRTTLRHDADGNLERVVYPGGETYSFACDDTGLLTAFTDPRGNVYHYAYDQYGHVTDAMDPAGGHWQYGQSADAQGVTTSVLSAEGGHTTYRDRDDGGALRSTITAPDGSLTEYYRSADGNTVRKELSCGTTLDFAYDIDPVFRTPFVGALLYDSGAGLLRESTHSRTYFDDDGDGSFERIVTANSVNGDVSTVENNVTTGTAVVETPMGRTGSIHYDTETLQIMERRIAGLYPVRYSYDARGRATELSQGDGPGERKTTFAYDSNGNLFSVTDALLKTTSFTYDASNRRTAIVRPDNTRIDFTYDANGNLASITVPDASVHNFDYTPVNLTDGYSTPPALDSNRQHYTYNYDRDRRLVEVILPSGRTIGYNHSPARLESITTPEGQITLEYGQLACSGKLTAIQSDSERIEYSYQGSVLSEIAQLGSLSETIHYEYDNNLRISRRSYAGGVADILYDADGLMTAAGDFAITHTMENGLPVAVSDTDAGGTYQQSRSFTPFAEQDSQAVTVGGAPVYSWILERDAAGRIVRKTETLDTSTSIYEYAYDTLGRLTTVMKDGAMVESYTYGVNGARTQETNALRGVADKAYAYRPDHSLRSAGDVHYSFDADGFLASRTDSGTGEAASFQYSSRGELLRVSLPDGRVVSYRNDPLGRRIAKMIDGAVVEQYLWQGMTTLLAVLHADGSLKYRFEYADDRTPVAMTHAGQRFYLAYDQVGSLRAVTDASGAIVKAVTYDSFGNVLEDSNPPLNLPFGFAGGLHDADTGLVRFGFRDYAPEVGRWTAKDPIGFGGGDSDLYGYCGGDPVNYIDEDGTELYKIGGGGVSFNPPYVSVTIGIREYSSLQGQTKKICIAFSGGSGIGAGVSFYLYDGFSDVDKLGSINSSNSFLSDGFLAIIFGSYASHSESSASLGISLGLGAGVTLSSSEYEICFTPNPCPYQPMSGRGRK